MKWDDPRIRCSFVLAAIGAISLLVVCSTTSSGGQSTPLDADLARIRHSDRWRGVDLPELEARCLKLIADHNSPREKGKIHATIALIYSEGGYKSSEDPRLPKTAAYARKALEYPLDVLTACQMYGSWVDSVSIPSRKYEREQFARMRQNAIVLCLKGLKLALDSGAPKERRPLPDVPRLHISPEHPQYSQMMEDRRQRVAAREKAESENALYVQRWALSRRCITLYSRAPYDVEQFRSEGRKVLAGYDRVVAEIAVEIEKGIAFDKSIHSPDPNSLPRR